MSADWAQLETHVVNGAFPLQRCVGSTEYSGVFLTQATKHAPSAVALKLVPADPAYAANRLEAWRVAAGLSHPHLLRIFEVGECRLGGSDYLYARMEFAEQTLAQLLEQRALTEEETRDLLAPTLDALEYLHRRGLVHAGLKPSNILVVADRLKLASDTVIPMGAHTAESSIAADVRALGILLCEALTRRSPIDARGDVDLPRELPPSFRELLTRCLDPEPGGHAGVADLKVWLNGDVSSASPLSASKATESSATRLVIRVDLTPAEIRPVVSAPVKRARPLPWIFGAAALAAIAWFGYRAIAVRAPAAVVPRAEAPQVAAPVIRPSPVVVESPRAEQPGRSDGPVEEVLPSVSQSALQTIRGTLRVSVRVTVDGEGRVATAVPDDAGPSRYFERHAVEASKQWKFAAADLPQRKFRLRFAFTRSGVKAGAEPLK